MQRKRLTITINKSLIDLIDAEVDGVKIRNRSHAIETLLAHKLNPPVKKAIILAADKGIKFRPFTYETPKSMLPVNGRPLLEHIITGLRDYDIREIYISVGYLSDKIKSYFGNGSKFGVNINYVKQNRKNLGTAGALKNFQQFIGPFEAFFLIYGDVLAGVNYHDMSQFYYNHKGVSGVMGLTTVKDPEHWGVVKLQGHLIKQITEKPAASSAQSHVICAGIYLLNAKIFPYIPNKRQVSLEKAILPQVLKQEKLAGYLFAGDWYDISTPEVYEEVLRRWV